MRMFLRKLGYDAALAVNGVEVLDMVGKERFDVILMDVNMDVMDGVECTRRLRAQADAAGARVYIIAQTANAHTESKQRCLQVGMNAFLPKPVILEELSKQLRMARAFLDRYDRKNGA